MNEVTSTRNSLTTTSTVSTAGSSISQRSSVLTEPQRQPHFTATEITEHISRADPSIPVDELHPLAAGTVTISENNQRIRRSSSSSSNSNGSNTNRGSPSLNNEVRRLFRGTASLLSSNSPSRDRPPPHHRQQSPQSYSHRQHIIHHNGSSSNSNNDNVHRSRSSSNTNASRSRTQATHPPTAPSSTRRSKYPMALPTEINQVYDGPVRGTAIIDSNYILDCSPVFEMITNPISTHRLNKRLSSDVGMRSNSTSLCDNPVTATTTSNSSDNNNDENDDDDEKEEEAGSDGNNESDSHSQRFKNIERNSNSKNTKKDKEPECNEQVSKFESFSSELMNEENSSPIMIEADNTGRLHRSNNSRFSIHGSFRMMKGSTASSNSNSSNYNISATNTASSSNNDSSQSTSLANKSLPHVVCASKAREANGTVHVVNNNGNNRNINVANTETNSNEERLAFTTINNSNNNNLQHSNSEHRPNHTNLFSLHLNDQTHANALQETTTNQQVIDVNTNNHNNTADTNIARSRLAEHQEMCEEENQQEEHRQGSSNDDDDVNYQNVNTNHSNDNHNDDNVVAMSSFEEEPQVMPEVDSGDVNNSHRVNNENAANDSTAVVNDCTTDNNNNDNNATTDNLPSCPCQEHSEPLQVLDGDYVLFSDSFIESDPSSIVAVMTHEFKQTCIRCNTIPNKSNNAERTRLQAVREVLAEAEVECRPLFRRVPSELVYGSSEYLPAGNHAEAERSMHDIIEDHEVSIQEEQTKEDNITAQTQHDEQNVQKTSPQKVKVANKTNSATNKASQQKSKKTNSNNNGDNLTIRQMTLELEQDTLRVWHDHHDHADE